LWKGEKAGPAGEKGGKERAPDKSVRCLAERGIPKVNQEKRPTQHQSSSLQGREKGKKRMIIGQGEKKKDPRNKVNNW